MDYEWARLCSKEVSGKPGGGLGSAHGPPLAGPGSRPGIWLSRPCGGTAVHLRADPGTRLSTRVLILCFPTAPSAMSHR